jgi:[ribosomal protein S5]-alanine N-acetyltransferase
MRTACNVAKHDRLCYIFHNPRTFVKAPEILESSRLLFRRPRPGDAEEIFSRYAGDPDITRYMSFPTHRSIRETRAFLSWSDAEWERWPAGPYLARLRESNVLVGSTGLSFETPYRAMTGYIFARDAWGVGYAGEALRTMGAIAPTLGVRRLYALCHTAHERSRRVLEKEGYLCEGILRRYMEFPNVSPGEPADVYCYSLLL